MFDADTFHEKARACEQVLVCEVNCEPLPTYGNQYFCCWFFFLINLIVLLNVHIGRGKMAP